VALLDCFVCRIAGWRAEAVSWHDARGAQEAPGRQLEMLPRDGDHRMRCNTVELTGTPQNKGMKLTKLVAALVWRAEVPCGCRG
jgi:hypothetical protein